MTEQILFPREEVKKFEPYLPGRSMAEVKKEYKLKRVIKLASNENALGPSPRAVQALKKTAALSYRYPDSFSVDLRNALAEAYNVKTSEVSLGAGSDELIEVLAKTYLTPNDEIVVSDHAFIRYEMAADLMGARTRSVPMNHYTHDLDAMANAVTDKTRFVFVANPNNPTGTYNNVQQLTQFLEKLPNHVLPVIDEAYFEYANVKSDYPDALQFFKKGHPLLLLRTFSKIHGLAGLRLGYGIGPESIIESLERVRPPFNISTAAQAAGLAAFDDKKQVKRSVQLNEKEKNKIEKALKKMGMEYVPSAANFLLIHVSPCQGKDFAEKLLQKGIIVRAMEEYNFPHHIRATLGLPKENDQFLKALSELI